MDEAIKLFNAKDIPVFRPGDDKKIEEQYEHSVANSNLLFRFSRPDCVVEPESVTHVETVLKEAKSRKLKVTIKGGGHSFAGHSTASQGISLDLKRMKNVTLDLDSKTVTVDSGCLWSDVYKTLIDKGEAGNGFIVNGSKGLTVGVGGYIMGGGLGPFTRTIGMGSDTLLEATVVAADGETVTVNKDHARDSKEGQLFWALRGAGGGNFGVLVSMKLSVAQLQNKDGTVVAGRYQWFPSTEKMDSLVPTMIDFYTADWPTKITIDSTWLCDLRQNTGDGIRFLTYFDGGKQEFDNLMDKHFKYPELVNQFKRRSLEEKSTRFLHETLEAQWSEEAVRSYPTNKTYSIYTSFVFSNDRPTIEMITTIIEEKLRDFRRLYSGEKVAFLTTWIHSGGKAAEPKPSDSAFYWRQAMYHCCARVEWEDKWMERDMRGFFGDVKKELRDLSLNGEAAFINFPDGTLSKKGYERAYFGENRHELRRIKAVWDPDNMFEWDQGVQLPDGAEDDQAASVDLFDDEELTDSIASRDWKVYESKDAKRDLVYLGNGGFLRRFLNL